MSPQLVVKDINHSIDFYTNVLAFHVDFRYEDFYAGIVKDGYSIYLKTGEPSIETREHKRENEHIDIVFSVDNIESLFDELSSKSINITQPLRDMPYGKEFYVADPDGYIIAFLEEA